MIRYLLAAAVLCALLLWRIDHVTADRDGLQQDLSQAVTRTEELQSMLRTQRELNADLEELDRKHTEDLSHAQAENTQLAADVAAGKRRLRIQANCPGTGVPDPTGTAGVDDGEAAELTPAAQQDYFALRGQLTRTESALAGLQEYVTTVCLRPRATE